MTSNIAYIKAFNDLLDQFYEFLSTKFPQISPDILIAQTFTNFLRTGNPKEVVKSFMQHTSPYQDQIFECNESFFLDYQNNLKESNSNEMLTYAPKLKQIWEAESTTDMDKAQIWLFFHKLLKLGSKVTFV